MRLRRTLMDEKKWEEVFFPWGGTPTPPFS
jgi:hypothetical protein